MTGEVATKNVQDLTVKAVEKDLKTIDSGSGDTILSYRGPSRFRAQSYRKGLRACGRNVWRVSKDPF